MFGFLLRWYEYRDKWLMRLREKIATPVYYILDHEVRKFIENNQWHYAIVASYGKYTDLKTGFVVDDGHIFYRHKWSTSHPYFKDCLITKEELEKLCGSKIEAEYPWYVPSSWRKPLE